MTSPAAAASPLGSAQLRLHLWREVQPRQGQGVIFPVHHHPVCGSRGYYCTVMRHGVSRILTGQQHTLGIIFHDAA